VGEADSVNAEQHVDPKTVQARLDKAGPGDVIVLGPGRYTEALRLIGRRGNPMRPITIRAQPGAVIDGGISFTVFNHRAQLVAKADWLLGRRPPGIQSIALEAMLTIDSCEHVRVEGLAFRATWPTAVLVDTSRDVILSRLHIRDSAFAFFLHGELTRGIVIERCTWLQDVTRGDLWRRIAWDRIHGDDWHEADVRGLDGDFVRSYRIAGDLTVRHNRILHAFNGVHCFNRRPDFPDTLNRNVYIYGNYFACIRDNPIEPEGTAWNWWVFHNRFFNCHKWFSLELERSGYFYIFGNLGWFDEIPGPPKSKNQGGAVFKFGEEAGPGHGPHYVFNNSWYLRSPLADCGRWADLEHTNNAVLYCGQHPDHMAACTTDARLFGDTANGSEEERFTKEWAALKISFANDCIAHHEFPEPVRAAGYPVEGGIAQDPGFRNPAKGDFRLNGESPCRGKARQLTLELLGRPSVTVTPRDIGAFQDNELIEPPAGVVPDYGEVPSS
jgi:hypothetical protein